MGVLANRRALGRIAELAGQGNDLVTFWRASSEVLARAVPHYLTPCFFTLDPASLLVTSHYQDGLPEIPHDWLADEYYGDDVNKMIDVARSATGAATLHEATGGRPERSNRYLTGMQPYGAEQELIVALRARSGEVWGCLGLYREPGAPMFGADEIAFLCAASPHLAEGARRGLLIGEATDGDRPGPDAPGLVVLGEEWDIESLTPGVERWLEELPGGDAVTGQLPPSVLAVAGLARRSASHPDAAPEVATARVLSRSGRWVVLHGAAMAFGEARRVAVILEPAHPARIAPLLMSVYELTGREQEVTRLVLQGDSTAEIAQRLSVSPSTVQEHLKSVFEKTGVRSRRDLVGKVFFAHYEPRVRDNERRVVVGKPVRGGPA